MSRYLMFAAAVLMGGACELAAGQQPRQPLAPAPAAEEAYLSPAAAESGWASEWDGETAGDCGRGCHGFRRVCGAYDMPQHYPYYPPMHGYYYSHPYHHAHVPAQQAFASRFGVDPRNPYSNDVFKIVYAEYRASLVRPRAETPDAPFSE